MQNICQFVPVRNYPDSLRTIHFVLETEVPDSGQFRFGAAHTLHLVTGGEGILHWANRSAPLQKGDLFFIFPGVPFRIEKKNTLTYLYISFIGVRATRILEELHLRSDTPILHQYGFLEEKWQHALSICNEHNLDLVSESVLLGTFAEISARTVWAEKGPRATETVVQMQQYIDEHFCEPDLSLDQICRKFSYSVKYGSSLLKQHLNMGFREYLRSLRIQYACALMLKGVTSIKNVAALCGYPDQAYFSRVFHQAMACSPKEWLFKQPK